MHLNTSNVNVNHGRKADYKFKKANLNTSNVNVNVNLPSNSTGFILQRNLNTSNVNVNLNTSLCYIPVTGI